MHYIVVGQHEMHIGILPKEKKKRNCYDGFCASCTVNPSMASIHIVHQSLRSGIAVCLFRGGTSLSICPMLPHVALYRESHKSVKKSGCALFSVCSVRGSFGSGLTTTFMFNHGRNAVNTFIRKLSLIPVTRCMWNVTKISKIVGFFLVKRREFLKFCNSAIHTGIAAM